jgi:hypothetical protein
MENKMTEEMANTERNGQVLNQQFPTVTKKKASWLHTILWMFSMVLLANIVMGILAYFLFFRNK